MNNEPVAWTNKEFFEDEPQAEELHEILQSNAELTDEEISEVFKDCTKDGILDANDFAKAILRKASEK